MNISIKEFTEMDTDDCPFIIVSASDGVNIKYFLSTDKPLLSQFEPNIEKYGLRRNLDGSLDCRRKKCRELIQRQFNMQEKKTQPNVFKNFVF